MEIKSIQSGQLPFQAPHQRQKNLDYICSLTWGWAHSSSLRFVLSSASTAPHAPQHSLRKQAAFVPCWWLAVHLSPVGTLNGSVSFMYVWWGHWTDWGGPQLFLLAVYFDIGNLLQRTEAQSTVDTIQCNPIDLCFCLSSLMWALGMGWGKSIFLFIVINSSSLCLYQPFPALSPCTLK